MDYCFSDSANIGNDMHNITTVRKCDLGKIQMIKHFSTRWAFTRDILGDSFHELCLNILDYLTSAYDIYRVCILDQIALDSASVVIKYLRLAESLISFKQNSQSVQFVSSFYHMHTFNRRPSVCDE